MFRRIIIMTYALCFFLLVGCNKKDPVAPVSPKEDITMENIMGKWYSLFADPEISNKMVFFLDNRSDSTATIGILNGPTEVSLLEVSYYVDNNVYVFIAPEVDTSKQNALQIMFADDMGGLIYSDEIYLAEGKLHFVEGEETFVFSKTIPPVSGGKITGSLTVTGEFGQGAAIISAYDPVKETIGVTFLSQPGLYYLQGLADGEYLTLATYIPKEHALDWMYHDPSYFPYELRETEVEISGGNTVSNINFNLNLSNVGSNKYSIKKDTREHKIAIKCFQMLKNLSIFTK